MLDTSGADIADYKDLEKRQSVGGEGNALVIPAVNEAVIIFRHAAPNVTADGKIPCT